MFYAIILQLTRNEAARGYGQAAGILLVTIVGAVLYFRWKKKNK